MMTPAVAAVVGLLAGVGGTVAAQRYMHYDEHKDRAAKKLLDAAKTGTLPVPELKKAAVAFGVEAIQSKRKGKLARARAYEQAMVQVTNQGAAIGSHFGGGFNLGDVIRDVGIVVGDPYLTNPPPPTPDYPPLYAPDLYGSGPYDYHMGPMYSQMPGAWRHAGRHI